MRPSPFTSPISGHRRPCPRCKVDRHDRCTGPDSCGCQHQDHTPPGWQLDPDGLPTTHTRAPRLGDLPEDTAIVLEAGMDLRTYRRLEQTAIAQDRTVDVVLRRALECYWCCPKAGCPHHADEVPEAL